MTTLPAPLINTHRFDGALRQEKQKPRPRQLLERIRRLSPDFRRRAFLALLDRWMPRLPAPEANMLARIAADQGKPPNYDNTNDLWADDLLLGIYLYVPKTSERCLLSTLRVHLHDMLTGGCPQGRVIRLWQIWRAFIGF